MTRRSVRAGLVAVATTVALLSLAGPALAVDPARHDSLVLQVNADVTIPAETRRDAVIVIRGDAAVAGAVDTLIVIDGTATLTGARVGTLIVTGGAVDIDATSVVQTTRTLDAAYRPAVAALALLVGLPLLTVALMVSVVGIPTGVALLLVVTPLIWFVGSVAVAVRIGDWTLLRLRGRTEASHPLVAAAIGLVVIGVLSIIPFVGFVIGLAGAGAAFLVAWRAATAWSTPGSTTPMPGTVAA